MLGGLGRFCHDRRGLVVAIWIAALFALGGLSATTGGAFSTKFSPPDVESAHGLATLNKYFHGAGGGFGGTVVFKADQGVQDPNVRGQMTAFLDYVNGLKPLQVTSPYAPQGQFQLASQGPLAGKLAFARVDTGGDISVERAAVIAKDVKGHAPKIAGLQIEYGGQVFSEFAQPKSETIGLGFAIVILILAFGSVLAMGLPIGTAAGGIFAGVAVTTLASNILTMPNFTTTLGVMIGLGVGIDYALFIATRYREALHAGLSSSHATAVAMNTAGRAVIFAGTTVVISLLGMLLMGLAFVRGLAVGAAIVVLMTMVASITLLPALLGFVRERVELTRWRGLLSAGLVALAFIGMGLQLKAFVVAIPVAAVVLVAGLFVPLLKREAPTRARKPIDQTLAYRWSRVVQRRPWAAVLVGATILVALGVPTLSIRLGFSDEGNAPPQNSNRKAYDLLAAGFGPGFNGPIVLAAELPPKFDINVLGRVTDTLKGTPGVAFVTPAVPDNFLAPKAVVWRLLPTTAPQAVATEKLLHHLRQDVLPTATAGSRLQINTTGFVAISADFSQYLGDRLPLFIGVVLALSFLLLLVVFRSVLVPLKAVVMNLLSIGAAYGVVVIVFQWGWFKSLAGIGSGPIEPFIPMMMFAIVFGLSMDYEVFLLSRVKEEYDRGKANDQAVADGLAATARVITAAAAIMVVVFGSFMLEFERSMKMMGTGLAVAILFDATIVRMLLVPATMELLGDRNWWLPGWLDRLLPNVTIEGHSENAAPLDDRPGQRDKELVGAD